MVKIVISLSDSQIELFRLSKIGGVHLKSQIFSMPIKIYYSSRSSL